MKQDTYTEASALLQQYAERHNLRASYERDMVLKAFCEQKKAVTSAEIVEAVAQHNISRATVFNTIRLLLAAQIVSVVQDKTTNNARRYEMNICRSNKIEIICSKCGRITQSTDKVVETQLYGKRWRNFNMSSFAVYVYGECKHCRTK